MKFVIYAEQIIPKILERIKYAYNSGKFTSSNVSSLTDFQPNIFVVFWKDNKFDALYV